MSFVQRRSCVLSRVCNRCGMRFGLAAPAAGAEITRCAEIECGRRFWHCDGRRGVSADRRTAAVETRVRVGIDPAWGAPVGAPSWPAS